MRRGPNPRGGPAGRRALLSLLALAGLSVAVPEAVAQAQRRPVASFPAASRLTPAARESLRRWLCPNGGAPVRGAPGRCDGRRQAEQSVAAAPTGDAAGDAAGWFRDLAPARGGQAACPEGFRPAPARGHADVTRCLPG